MGVKVADKFVAMGDFELLDAQDVLVDIGGTPKRLQEAIDNGELGDKYSSNAPIGVIQAFSGQTAPHGYLICDGASYKVADYPDLYAVIGNTYGGDSTNFNVPNLVDKFIQGSTTSGTEMDAGLPNITGEWIPGSVPDNHSQYAKGAIKGISGVSETIASFAKKETSGYGFAFDASKSNSIYGNSDTVQPPALTMVYIIKAFHTNEGVDSDVYTGVKQVVTVPLISLNANLSAGSSTQIFWDNSMTVDSLIPSGTILRWRYIVTGVSQASGQLSIGGGTASLKNDETSTACAYPKVTNWIDTHLDGLANLVPSVTLYAKTVSIQIEYIA